MKNGLYAGNVSYKAEWLGLSSKMPPRLMDQSKEINLKEKLLNFPLDMNDPRNSHFLSNLQTQEKGTVK